MTKQEILGEFDQLLIVLNRIPATEKVFALDVKSSVPIKNWLSEKLDTYAMEFLKECLPDSKAEYDGDDLESACKFYHRAFTTWGEVVRFQDGFDSCRMRTLNNANNYVQNKKT